MSDLLRSAFVEQRVTPSTERRAEAVAAVRRAADHADGDAEDLVAMVVDEVAQSLLAAERRVLHRAYDHFVPAPVEPMSTEVATRMDQLAGNLNSGTAEVVRVVGCGARGCDQPATFLDPCGVGWCDAHVLDPCPFTDVIRIGPMSVGDLEPARFDEDESKWDVWSTAFGIGMDFGRNPEGDWMEACSNAYERVIEGGADLWIVDGRDLRDHKVNPVDRDLPGYDRPTYVDPDADVVALVRGTLLPTPGEDVPDTPLTAWRAAEDEASNAAWVETWSRVAVFTLTGLLVGLLLGGWLI